MEKSGFSPLRLQMLEKTNVSTQKQWVERGSGEKPLPNEWQNQRRRQNKCNREELVHGKLRSGKNSFVSSTRPQRNTEHGEPKCWISWNWSTLLQEQNVHLLILVMILWNTGRSFAWSWGPAAALQLETTVELLLRVQMPFKVEAVLWFHSKERCNIFLFQTGLVFSAFLHKLEVSPSNTQNSSFFFCFYLFKVFKDSKKFLNQRFQLKTSHFWRTAPAFDL